MKAHALKNENQASQVQLSDKLDQYQDKQVIVKSLSKMLANSFLLYLKTFNFHWNVEGERFIGIHTLTEEHYKDMQNAIDEIAERIRALGFYAPGSFQEFSKITNIEESDSEPKSSDAMLKELINDHMLMVSEFEAAAKITEEHKDHSTTDLFSNRRAFHEKAAWMLRSLTK